jgi:hypothetical protein
VSIASIILDSSAFFREPKRPFRGYKQAVGGDARALAEEVGMSIFVESSRYRSVGAVGSAGWIQVFVSAFAMRLLDRMDHTDAFDSSQIPLQNSDAMIAAARSTFANVDILVGRRGLRYVPRSVAKI